MTSSNKMNGICCWDTDLSKYIFKSLKEYQGRFCDNKGKCFVLALIDLTGNCLLKATCISIYLEKTVLNINRYEYEWRQILFFFKWE